MITEGPGLLKVLVPLNITFLWSLSTPVPITLSAYVPFWSDVGNEMRGNFESIADFKLFSEEEEEEKLLLLELLEEFF